MLLCDFNCFLPCCITFEVILRDKINGGSGGGHNQSNVGSSIHFVILESSGNSDGSRRFVAATAAGVVFLLLRFLGSFFVAASGAVWLVLPWGLSTPTHQNGTFFHLCFASSLIHSQHIAHPSVISPHSLTHK